MAKKSRNVIDSALRSVPLFASWPNTAIDELVTSAGLRQYAKGECIIQAGDMPTGVYVIVEGTLYNERIWESGKRLLMGILRPGWPLKIGSTWDGRQVPHGLTARTDALIAHIPRETFLKVVKGDIERVQDIVTFMCLQLRAELVRVNLATLGSLRCQIAANIFSHTLDAMVVVPEGTDVFAEKLVGTTDLTQDEIAAAVGCSRQKVNNTMKLMERDGILRRKGRLVEVVDYERLIVDMEDDEPLPQKLHDLASVWQKQLKNQKQFW